MTNFVRNTFLKIKENKNKILILSLIIVLGIFLRTYNFHAWLPFENDQVRDATLVNSMAEGKSAWPLLGPTMRGSGALKEFLFHLGPIYYYFQITSAEIFGNAPDKLAYPDLFFSILSIPLFYYFLKKYFNASVSLGLTGLYAISFYAVQYSRFAWNPNSIPFFVILFLFSLYEFLANKEKTRWIWIIFLGISLGVGIQLHAILFILFPATAFFVFAYLMKKNWRLWKKWAIVLMIFFLMNTGQIISEFQTNFFNSKIFLNYFSGSSEERKGSVFSNLANDASCQIEANAYILSAYGKNNCSTYLVKLITRSGSNSFFKEIKHSAFWIQFLITLAFSVFGYLVLVFRSWKETDERKKYFLRLISLYAILSLLVMYPIIKGGFDEFRYFNFSFFVPFLFLGFLFEYLSKKFGWKNWIIFFLVASGLIITNVMAASPIIRELSSKSRTGESTLVLGEIEPMANYLIFQSKNKREIYLGGNYEILRNVSAALGYLTEKKNIALNKTLDINGAEVSSHPDVPLFYVEESSKNPKSEIGGQKVRDSKKFGQIIIYELRD
jgi:hypothetical protein